MTLSTTAEMPRGEAIGRYSSYADAQKAVDYLADQQFEVAKISIIGSDLKSVEQVTGRLSYPKVALQGALNGMVFGAFFGLLMSLLGGMDLAQALLLPIIMGGAFWMLLATVTYATQRGKRDFTSTNRIVAGSYEVIAAPEVAGEARHVLGGLTLRQAPGPRQHHGGWNQPQRGPGGRPGQWGPQQGQYGQGGPHGQQGRPGPNGPYPPRAQHGQHGGSGAYGGQPGPQQGQPGQWSGQPAPQGGANGAAPQGQPAYGQRIPEQGQEPSGTNRSAKFPDLPDGRPQYGIRLEPQGPADPQGQSRDGDAPSSQSGPQDRNRQGSTASGAPWSQDREGQGREGRDREGRDQNK